MRKMVRRELRMLREVAHHVLPMLACPFCHEPLLPEAAASKTFGHKDHPPVLVKITLHHRNGNHADNRPANRVLAHDACHRGYHARLRAKARRRALRLSKSATTGKEKNCGKR